MRKPLTRAAARLAALLALVATAPLGAQRSAPQISTAPHHPGFRDVGAGTSALAYSTPAYVSRDQPRSVGLFYTSGQAAPLGFVQVDATDVSADPPQRITISVTNPWGWSVTPELSYAAGSGANRLAAVWDASAYGTGALLHTVVVRSYWADGTVLSNSASVRVPIINETASRFGAGWSVAGLQRLHVQPDGIFIQNGDGSGSFFAACSGCGYTAPEGDFSTLAASAGGGYTRTWPDGSKVVFRADGLMSYREDRLGERDTWGWGTTTGGVAVPVSLTDHIGKQITFAYGTSGYLSTLTDPGGRVSQVLYNGTDVYRIIRPDNRAAFTATYDASHRLSQWNDAGGGQWNAAYDRGGALASVTAPQVVTSDAGTTRPVTTLKSLFDAVLVQPGYGFSGQPASPRVLPANVRVQVADPRGSIVRAAVDRYGAPVLVEEPYGRVTTITRNQHGQVTRTVSPTGHAVSNTWNGVELTRVLDETVNDTAFASYEPMYHQPTYIRHGLQRDSLYYSSAGVLDSTVSLGGGTRRVQRYSYYQDGRLYSVTDPEGHGQFYTYEVTSSGKLDNLGGVTVGMAGYMNNRTTVYSRDALGRDTMTTSPNNDKTRVGYDVLNRVIRSTDALGNSTVFAFDSLGSLVTVTDPKYQVYHYTRNALGWVTSETDPRLASITYQYDRAGNATSVTNRRGQTVTMAYDSLHRVTSRSGAGANATWSYDPAGLWSQVSNAESTDREEYDAAGRLLRTLVTRGSTTYGLENTLDAKGRRTQLSVYGPWSGAHTSGYRYNERSQVDSIIDFAGSRTLMGYDADGLWTGPALPMNWNFFGIQRSHLSTHVPAEIKHPYQVADVLNTAYTLNNNGLLSARSQRFTEEYYGTGTRVNSYTYDRLGQLTQTTVNEYYDSDAAPCGTVDPNVGKCLPSSSGGIPYWVETRTYSWDATGNPTGSSFTVENGNRLTRASPFYLEYDADGNLTRKYRTDGPSDQRLYWNALGQLDSVSTNGTKVRYGYNGLGQRIRAGTRQFLYDGADLLMELNSSGLPDRSYTYYPGVDNPHSVRLANGATYYYSTDFPGNVVALVNKNRQIVAQYTYDDFGHSIPVVDSIGGQPLQFAARELDEATGLYYVRARWYDPYLGRFISEDPIGLEGGINPYAYAGNSPVNATDPFGLCIKRNGASREDKAKVKRGEESWCPEAIALAPLIVIAIGPNPFDEPRTPLPSDAGGAGAGTSAPTSQLNCPNVTPAEMEFVRREGLTYTRTGTEEGHLLYTLGVRQFTQSPPTGPVLYSVPIAYSLLGYKDVRSIRPRTTAGFNTMIHWHPSGRGISVGDSVFAYRTGMRVVSGNSHTRVYGSINPGGRRVTCKIP